MVNQVMVLCLSRVDLVEKGLDAQFIVRITSLDSLLIHELHQVSVLGLARVDSFQESFKIGVLFFFGTLADRLLQLSQLLLRLIVIHLTEQLLEIFLVLISLLHLRLLDTSEKFLELVIALILL